MITLGAYQSAECKPGGVTVLRAISIVAEAVSSDAEEDHVKDPSDQGREEGERSGERHEDSSGTMVSSAAKAEEECKTREAGS